MGLECRGLSLKFKKSLISRMLCFRNQQNLLRGQTEISPTRRGVDCELNIGQIHKDIYLSILFKLLLISIFLPPMLAICIYLGGGCGNVKAK